MPEFFPDHVPSDVDEFTAGYLGAAEWLLSENDGTNQNHYTPRDKIRGWTRKAIREAKADCADFQKANEADLAAFCETIGRDMESAGHDFWLTRNGHGAGFWGRGAGDVGDKLSDAAHVYGECNAEPYRGWIYFL